MGEKGKTTKILKCIIFFLLLIIAALLVGVILLSLEIDNKEDKSADATVKSLPQTFSECTSEKFKISTEIDSGDTIFHELTEKEVNNVRSYLIKQEGLVEYSGRKTNQSAILFMDIYHPTKQEVLNYRDNKGAKPERQAYVAVGNDITRISTYLVWPVESPTNHKLLQLSDRQNPADLNTAPLLTFDASLKISLLVYFASRDLFPLYKETYEDFENSTNPIFLSRENINLLREFYTKVGNESKYYGTYYQGKVKGYQSAQLKYTMIYYLLDISSTNQSEWHIAKISYNNQPFANVTELNEAYKNKTLKVVHIPSVPLEELNREKLSKRDSDDLRPKNQEPIIYSPNGPRYSVTGRLIKYFDWQFEYSVSQLNGPGLFDVRYENQRMAYEVTLQDLANFYSAAGPHYFSGNILHALVTIGSGDTLVRGIDCPDQAIYLNTFKNAYSDKVTEIKDSICVFESSSMLPLRRHKVKSGTNYQYGGLNDNALIVRFIYFTGFQTSFTFDYIFHQNGVMEVKVTPSGHNLMDYKFENVTNGYELVRNHVGLVADDFVLFKVDLDISGPQNSFKILQMKLKTVQDVFDDIPMVHKKLHETQISTETNAAIRASDHQSSYFVVYNDKSTNRYSNARGYRINIKSSNTQVYPDDHISTKQAEWSKYQIAVTKYKEPERHAHCVLNALQQNNPPFCSFDQRIKDNENIVQQDLVAWVTIGGLRIPTAEDFPTITSVGNSYSFLLQPFNYFDEDPSMKAPNSVYIETQGNDTNIATYGVVTENTCGVPKHTYLTKT